MYCRWWGDIGGTRVAWTTSEFHDWERTKVFYGHYPSGSSIRCWQHMAQQFRAGAVVEYDYGHAKNMQVYGQSFPPKVDFSGVNNANVPVAMYVGKHDLIIFPKDSRRAHEEIKDVVVDYQEINGGHATFMIGEDQRWFLQDTMRFIRKYNPLP